MVEELPPPALADMLLVLAKVGIQDDAFIIALLCRIGIWASGIDLGQETCIHHRSPSVRHDILVDTDLTSARPRACEPDVVSSALESIRLLRASGAQSVRGKLLDHVEQLLSAKH